MQKESEKKGVEKSELAWWILLLVFSATCLTHDLLLLGGLGALGVALWGFNIGIRID